MLTADLPALEKIIYLEHRGVDAYDDPRFGTPKAISAKNWFDSARCDMVLAYLPKEINDRRPSYGTVIEIGWAIAMRKPTIIVTDDAAVRDHPLIAANIPWVFPDFEPALETIAGLCEVYVGAIAPKSP